MTDGPQQLTGYRLRDYDDLIARLGESRRTQGMSQHALARAAHVGHQQLGKWLTGSTWPLAPNLVAVIEALGYDLALIPRQPPDEDAPSARLSELQGCETRLGVPESTPGRSEPAETRSEVTVTEEIVYCPRCKIRMPKAMPHPHPTVTSDRGWPGA